MTEPKRWDASNCVRFCDRCDAEYGITAGADAGDDACSGCGADAPHVYPALADFDRLRDERDRLAEASETLAAVEESVREGFAAGRAAGHAADVKLLLDLAGSYQGSPYKLNAIAYEMAAKEIAARFPNGGTT